MLMSGSLFDERVRLQVLGRQVGQDDREARAALEAIAGKGAAAVRLRYVPYDRQAESKATVRATSCPVQPREAIEDAIQRIRRQPGPIIFDDQPRVEVITLQAHVHRTG